jgi:hypothetical protein
MQIRSLSSTLFLSAAMALTTLFPSSISFAKPVKGAALGYAIDQCLLSSDAQTRESATKFGCCSHEAGICVICPKPPSAGNTCEVTPYRTNGLSGIKGAAAGDVLQNQMMQSK